MNPPAQGDRNEKKKSNTNGVVSMSGWIMADEDKMLKKKFELWVCTHDSGLMHIVSAAESQFMNKLWMLVSGTRPKLNETTQKMQ